MTTSIYETEEVHDDEYQAYRAVSKAAVLSLILSSASIPSFWWPMLLFLPAVAILFGLIGLSNIKRYQQELTGRIPARIGLILGAILLLGGTARHAYVYATEVPDDYTRISFSDLQPTADAPHLPFSPRALELNGRKVFIKGYVYPDGQQYGITHFVMVRDLGTCCFGGQPKLTHMMEIKLQDPLTVNYALRKRNLGGILRVNASPKPIGKLGGVFFQLDADFLNGRFASPDDD